MAALVVFALVLLPVMGFNKIRRHVSSLFFVLSVLYPAIAPWYIFLTILRYRAKKQAQKELRLESERIASEHERLYSGETAYEPPPYEEIVSAYDVNRNVDDAVKRPLGRDQEWRSYQSQRAQG